MELQETIYADRSERGKLKLTGPQRGWFLDQILTQSVEDMAPGEAREAAMITVHGRMTAYMEMLATEEAILMHFEPELRVSLPDAMAGYVFATRVEIADVTDELGLVLVAGPRWQDAASAAEPGAPLHPTRSLGVPAGYVWVAGARTEHVLGRLRAEGLRAAGEDELEARRIAAGVPRWGFEMDSKTFPQEAGVDAHAVHYDKGCYLGQEAMAKIHFRGKVNRRLVRLEAAVPLERGAEVSLEGAKVGAVTSAAGGDALAIVKHSLEPGSAVTAAGVDAKVAD